MPVFYREWLANGMETVLSLPERVRSLLSYRFL
jgi:hypothetical protein